jgi:hypothetical protein
MLPTNALVHCITSLIPCPAVTGDHATQSCLKALQSNCPLNSVSRDHRQVVKSSEDDQRQETGPGREREVQRQKSEAATRTLASIASSSTSPSDLRLQNLITIKSPRTWAGPSHIPKRPKPKLKLIIITAFFTSASTTTTINHCLACPCARESVAERLFVRFENIVGGPQLTDGFTNA